MQAYARSWKINQTWQPAKDAEKTYKATPQCENGAQNAGIKSALNRQKQEKAPRKNSKNQTTASLPKKSLQ